MVETCLRIDETGDRAAVARPFLRAMVWQEEDDDDRIQGLVNTLRDDGSTSVVKERAARQIAEYCDDWDEENKTRVRRSGGIDALLRLADRIEIFEPSLEKFVALALWRLSRIPEKNRTAILNGGGVEPLVRLVDVGRSDDAREGATAALVNLMGFRTQEICALVIDVGGLTPLVRLAQEATTDGAKIAAAMALKLIAEHENFKNCVRDAGGIGALCSLVMSEDATARIREEAAWALSYLVQKNAENKRALGAVKGVFSALLSIVEGANSNQLSTDDGRRAAAWALFNASANNNENAQTVIANSGVTILCRVLKGRRKSVRRADSSWPPSTCCLEIAPKSREKPWEFDDTQDTAAAVSTAGEDEDFQDDNNDSLKAAAAAALIPLAENNEPVKVAIYNQGVVPCFSRLLNASDDKIKELATVMLCILTGVRARDGAIVVAVPGLGRVLASSTTTVNAKYAATEALANLAMTPGHRRALIQADAVPILVTLVNRSSDTMTKQAASQALASLAAHLCPSRSMECTYPLPSDFLVSGIQVAASRVSPQPDHAQAAAAAASPTKVSFGALLLLQHWTFGSNAPRDQMSSSYSQTPATTPKDEHAPRAQATRST